MRETTVGTATPNRNDRSDAARESGGQYDSGANASGLAVHELRKSFNGVSVVKGVSFSVAQGEFVSLLGPSGCGKTTTLRLIAGLEQVDSGQIRLGTADITGHPAHRRDVGVVFQSYALFPNMTVRDNIAYGLRARRKPSAVIQDRVRECLELVHLEDMGDRFPAQLSGGQQQRVALARALAISPRLLLLDEPLSNLDAKLRLEMRDEIRRIQIETGTTAVFVTHDQEEALSMSDRLVCMHDGVIEQIGSPAEIYNEPATPFVAGFVGRASVFTGVLAADSPGLLATDDGLRLKAPATSGVSSGQRALLVIKEERVRLLAADRVDTDNYVDAVCEISTFLGSTLRFKCRLRNGDIVSACVSADQVPGELRAGDPVRLGWSVDDSSLIKVSGGA